MIIDFDVLRNEYERRFIVTSYQYYVNNVSIISDQEYDLIAKHLAAEYELTSPQFKNLISLDDLKAGTGYAIDWESLDAYEYLREMKR